MLKMQTIGGKYVILDRGVNKVFDNAYDAWMYVFLMREVREKVQMPQRSLYPVRSLDPFPERRVKYVRIYT